jgi:heme/copper-type cytochrome/quinol oxidase subunit 2
MRDHHGESTSRIEKCFSILRKCRGKYECLLYEMLYIRELKPPLNTQSDSLLNINLLILFVVLVVFAVFVLFVNSLLF